MSETPRVDEWKAANKCANWPEVGISPFYFARELERELNSTTEERDELREEVKSLKETILDQENHIMELQARRPFTPGYTAEP